MNAPLAAGDSKSELAGRRILVTGAAGSFGRAVCARIAEAGGRLVITGRDTAKLEQLAAQIPGDNHQISPFDLNDAEGIVGWMRDLAEKDGPFAGIAHIAGICLMRPLRSITAEFVDKTLLTNVVSGIMLGKALRLKVCHTDGASMVLVSSTSSFTCGGANIAYAASKGAVTAATKGMAHELLRDKIRVNCIVPAVVDSDMSEYMRKTVLPENWQGIVAKQPLGFGSPDDIAEAILYLLSDQTRWMTGSALLMDGGLSVD